MDVRKNDLHRMWLGFDTPFESTSLYSLLEGVYMTHDIDDLLHLIEELEIRLIKLERRCRFLETHRESVSSNDSWYWDH